MEEVAHYRVHMNGRWTLADLYDFPHALSQAYAFFYCLDLKVPSVDSERLDAALTGYPWRGGYSYVNLYTVLKNQVAPPHRPRIVSIQYASPGWIELSLALAAVVKVSAAISGVLATGAGAVSTYKHLQSVFSDIAHRRARARVRSLELSVQQVQLVHALSDELSKTMGFENFQELVSRTGSVEVAGKIIAAQYRRVEKMAEFAQQGKAFLPYSNEQD